MNMEMDRICDACCLTFGAHRGDGTNQCPGHEGRMDWDAGPGTTFIDSGDVAAVPHGTPAETGGDI